jgi:ankyrin repeat protein
MTKACMDTMLTDTIKVLLKNGAEVSIRDRDGWTALKSAEVRNKKKQINFFSYSAF